MVSKSKGGYEIHVTTQTNPANNYVETINDIVDVLENENPEQQHFHPYLLNLLREMLPTYEQAKKMLSSD